MKSVSWRSISGWTALVVAASLVLSGCRDDDPSASAINDYYDGEVVTIIMPVGPGGAIDSTTRFWGQWLPKYFEGDVTFAYENMPGGGQLLALNFYELQAERDGLTLVIGAGIAHSAWRFELPGVEFRMQDWEPLVSQGGGGIFYARPDISGIESLDDFIDGNHEDLFFAGETPTGSSLMRVWGIEMLGVPMEIVWGYDGRAAGRIAVELGEANIDSQSASAYDSLIAPSVESGEAVLLFSLGQVTPTGLERDPFWPDLPHIGEIYELIHGVPPSGPMYDAYLLQLAIADTLGRTLYVHGDAPQEAIEALHHAWEQAVSDPEFLEASAEILGPYPPVIGEDLRQIYDSYLIEVDPNLTDFIADFVTERYDFDVRSGEG